MFNFLINTINPLNNYEFQCLHLIGETCLFLQCSFNLHYGLFIFVLVGLIFITITMLFNQNDSSGEGNLPDSSGEGNLPDSSSDGGPEDDERRRRELIKKVLIGLGVVTAVVAGCCGVSYILCDGDWFAFVTSPKTFWTSVGASLGLVEMVNNSAEMTVYLEKAWSGVFERITAPDKIVDLLGDLQFRNRTVFRKMLYEILHIRKEEIIRAVIAAHPSATTEDVLTASLEKALTCEIQTIGLKYAESVN